MNSHHQIITNQPVPDAAAATAWSSPVCSASRPSRRRAWPWWLTTLVVTVWFAAGCTTSKSSTVPARPGDGLREYQRLVRNLHQDVRRTSQPLTALAAASPKNPGAAYARFDGSLQRLEVDSITARARVDAMEKRGEAYFKEWAEEISGPASEATHRPAQERFAELHAHFEAILKDTGRVRQAFGPFLEGARGLRTKLGPKPTLGGIELARPDFAQLASAGRQAEESLDQLSKTLQAAAADVMSAPLPPAQPIAKP
jgi:hypothetical protein